MRFSTGFYGVPGTYHTTHVHLLVDGKPTCGYRPHARYEFQWCAGTIVLDYIDCRSCKAKALHLWEGLCSKV